MQFQFAAPTMQELHQFQAISIKTYRDTFEADNDPADFETYLSTTFTTSELTQLLEDPHYHVWLLYEQSEQSNVAGYFTLRDHPCPYPAIPGMHRTELHRFYLDSKYQGCGAGKQMMAFCLEQAKALGADSVWLGVWEHNLKAQNFYQKQGFSVVGQHDFWIGKDCQNDYLMQKSL